MVVALKQKALIPVEEIGPDMAGFLSQVQKNLHREPARSDPRAGFLFQVSAQKRLRMAPVHADSWPPRGVNAPKLVANIDDLLKQFPRWRWRWRRAGRKAHVRLERDVPLPPVLAEDHNRIASTHLRARSMRCSAVSFV
jgi:hypothetical protein